MIRVCRFVILATACLVSACGNESTDPSSAPSHRTVKLGMRSLSASGTLTPVNSNQTETDVLGSFQYSTLAVITVAGTETITYANLPGWGSLAGTTMGTFDAGGVFDGWSGSGDCSANVRYGFTQTGGRNICWYDNPNRPPPQSYTDTMVVRGKRNGDLAGWPKRVVEFLQRCDAPLLQRVGQLHGGCRGIRCHLDAHFIGKRRGSRNWSCSNGRRLAGLGRASQHAVAGAAMDLGPRQRQHRRSALRNPNDLWLHAGRERYHDASRRRERRSSGRDRAD